MRKVLVTTALEETWPDTPETPVLFLGEWCRLYSRKERWQAMKAEVLPYHWDDRQKLYQDYLYISQFYEKCLQRLGVKLNELHKVDHSDRYWRILIGPWLGYFLQILFDRWSSIQQVLCLEEDFETTILDYPTATVIPQNMSEFIQLLQEDHWNQLIYSKCIRQQSASKINFIQELKYLENNTSKRKREKYSKQLLKYLLEKSQIFAKDNQIFMMATYLPIWKQWRLDLQLKQFPQWRTLVEVPKSKVDLALRNSNLRLDPQNQYEEIAEKLLLPQIPISYLEGYSTLQLVVEKNNWPKSPKVIWTSNSENSDEVFKTYAAEQVEQGTKLIIGQHGGHYGIGLWTFTEDHNLTIADRYFSWGWIDGNQVTIQPTGQLKSKKPLGIKHHLEKKILLVTGTIPRYSYHMYSAVVGPQWLSYLEDQFAFCEALGEELMDSLLVRLYLQDYGWAQQTRWQDKFPEIELDTGEGSIEKKIAEARIYVSTYNATTYLESFTMDVPTIIYWNPDHWELRESAIPYFEELERVKVFHRSPESAARHIQIIWNDVNTWWKSIEVREAIDKFKLRYSWENPDLVGTLRTKIENLSTFF